MNYKSHKPPLNSLCLCGSKLKYKRCCFEDGTTDVITYMNQAIKLVGAHEFEKALVFIRKSITGYTIKHKSFTARFNPKDKAIKDLYDMDIDALAEQVDILLECYRGLNDYDQFIDDLERLRQNISVFRWQRKITYFQILGRLGDKWSESVGKKEVRKLEPIDEDCDPELIELYYHFRADDLPFNKKIEVLDRLINSLSRSSQLLQYKSCKGVCYFLIGDEEKATSIIEHALEEYKSFSLEEDGSYGIYVKARTLSLLGDLKQSADLKKKHVKNFLSF